MQKLFRRVFRKRTIPGWLLIPLACIRFLGDVDFLITRSEEINWVLGGAVRFLVTPPGTIALIAAGFCWVAWAASRPDHNPQTTAPDAINNSPATTQSAPESESDPQEEQVIIEGKKKGRIFVSVTVYDLCKMYQNHTSYQADKLFSDYKGKWLMFKGWIFNVSKSYGGGVLVSGDPEESVSSYYSVILKFDNSWEDHLSHLRKGDAIKVAGKIEDAESYDVRLVDCELI